jgi:ankyrin repeat protein
VRALVVLLVLAVASATGDASPSRVRHGAEALPRTHAQADEGVAVAAIHGDVQTLEGYLDEGGDPNAWVIWNRGRTTLLILAAISGELPAMRLLISHGAKLEQTNAEGYTALLMATTNLYRTGVESVRLLLDAGADVNHAFPQGTTALMHAACPAARHYGEVYYEAARLLVARGAEVDRRGPMGITALSEAEECDAERTRALLLHALRKPSTASRRRDCTVTSTCAAHAHGT